MSCSVWEVEDRLSQLAEEVLVSILSQLTMQEVVATSFLSSRWRYLWKHVPCLNFNRPKLPNMGLNRMKICTSEVTRHMSWVNHILEYHMCPVLEEFSISFPFLESVSSAAKCEVLKWLNFASSRKIQSLKLDFSVDGRWADNIRLSEYSFPTELLSSSLKGLKKLTLNRVRVDSQAVESLLLSCPLLELLSVTRSCQLVHLKVVGPSLKLKHLVIQLCPVKYMEIRNVNLVSFTFRGSMTNFVLENVSSVLNIDIGIITCGLLYKLAPKITTNFTQLVMLSLEGYHETMLRHFDGSFPTFNNLKWLMLRLYYVGGCSLLKSTPLLEAAPYLQKFTIELHRDNIKYVCEGRICRKTLKSPHQHLSEVQYRGYFGDVNDVELATYLFDNTLALEKFIVDPRVKLQENCEDTQRARDRAMLQLQPKVPKGVKLLII